MNKDAQTILLLPPSAQELEMLSVAASVLFVLAVATIALVTAYSGYLLVKTKLPGRIEVFLGAFLFAVFFTWSQYMGGHLEMSLGPLGSLVEVIAWSGSIVLFFGGHFRMLKRFRKMQ